MADGLNRVYLIGNLGADPELRHTQGDQAVLNLRIATTESWVDKEGERKERTDWHNVTIWGKRGEGLARCLNKGSRLCVEGRIQTRSYEKDGEKRYATDIVATNVVLLDGRRDGGDGRRPDARDDDGGRGRPRDDDRRPARDDRPRRDDRDRRPRERDDRRPAAQADEPDFAPPDDDIPF
jgi:single-strand DNA-binding protein